MKAKLLFQFFTLIIFVLFVYLIGCGPGQGPGSQLKFSSSKKICDTINSGVSQNLNAIIYSNPHLGTAVGDTGTVINTINGGYRWSAQISITPNDLFGIAATDDFIRVAVGESGTILRSTDGGVTWGSPISVNTLQTLRTVAFFTTAKGFAAGDSGVVLFTNTAGASWTKMHGDPTHNYYGLSYNSSGLPFVVGNSDSCISSTDGGVTWQSIIVNTALTRETFRSIHFALDSTFLEHKSLGFIVGDNGKIFKTTNDGTNWAIDTNITTTNLRSVFLTNTHWGYAVGEDGKVLRFTGKRWTSLPQATTRDLNGVDPPYAVTTTCIGERGQTLNYYPSPIPTGFVNFQEPDVTSGCQSWTFSYTLDGNSFNDPFTAGGTIIILNFSVTSSVPIINMPGATGWTVNDSFHYEGPITASFSPIIITPSTMGSNIITCCFKDAGGNPWLIQSYQCPPPP